jgi:hypothetical protein
LDGPEFDLCGSVGQVAGLNPNGDNYLSVRSKPESGSRELDRLSPDQMVWMCDHSGSWIGVVYQNAASGEDCDLGGSAEAIRPYHGPCQSGWVHEKFIVLIAG